jgi:hypothetical protein
METMSEVNGFNVIFGMPTQQKLGVLTMFAEILAKEEPDLIIEIGFGYGGISSFLALYSKVKNAKFHTYDIEIRIQEIVDIVINLSGNVCVKDIFDDESFIAEMIFQSVRCLIICDGENKTKELATFSKYLRNDDLIICHDYIPNKEIGDPTWLWCEVEDKDIVSLMTKYNLNKYMPNILEKYNWVGLKKV